VAYTLEELRAAGQKALQAYDAAVAAGNMDEAKKISGSVSRIASQAKMLEAQQAQQTRAERPAPLVETAQALPPAMLRGASETAGFVSKALPALETGIQAGGLKLMQALGLAGKEDVQAAMPAAPTMQSQLPEAMARLTRGYSEQRAPADNVPAQYAETIGEFAGGALAFPFGGPLRAAKQAIVPALASESAGQVAQAYAPEYESQARLLAALGVPVAQVAATPALRRMAIGDPEEVRGYLAGTKRPESVQTLKSAGVEDISAGQQIGSEQLMRLEGRVSPTLKSQAQLTKAALREAGVTGDVLATPSVLNKRRNELGAVFDLADDAVVLPPSMQEGSRMSMAVNDAMQDVTVGKVPDRLVNIADKFINAAAGRIQISANDLSKLRTDLSKQLTRFAKENDQVNYQLAYDMNEIVDDMIQRNVGTSSPELLDDLLKARKEYRSFLTAENAVNRAGSDASAGIITPAALASAARKREGVAVRRGTGTDLSEIASAAEEVLLPLPTVMAGGQRMIPSQVQSALELLPSMVARQQQGTLPLPLVPAMSAQLGEKLARQAGGLLAID
jgi:hypothetical protein